MEWVWRLIEESPQHTIINALSYALDLEHCGIEQKYFIIFKEHSKQIDDMLPMIIEENQKLVDLLKTELEKNRPSEI